MPLRIGSEVAFSLPWKGSSTAILIVPLLVSPPPPPPELGAVLAPDELHAANARALTAASAPNLCSFIQVSSKPTVVADLAQDRGWDHTERSLRLRPTDPGAPLGDRIRTAKQGRVSARGLASGQRAGGRRSDAVSYALAT